MKHHNEEMSFPFILFPVLFNNFLCVTHQLHTMGCDSTGSSILHLNAGCSTLSQLCYKNQKKNIKYNSLLIKHIHDINSPAHSPVYEAIPQVSIQLLYWIVKNVIFFWKQNLGLPFSDFYKLLIIARNGRHC